MTFPWDFFALGTDAFVAFILYKAYKSSSKLAATVEDTPYFSSGLELKKALEAAEEKTLNYAVIDGVVKPLGVPLKSSFNGTEGVIQNLSFLEHKSQRTQGYWSDLTKTIRNTTNVVPFALDINSLKVRVNEPLEASLLMENLHVVHDKYEPAQSTIFERATDRFFGEITKGFQEKESMLELGAKVVGIGKIVLSADGVNLLPPTNENQTYILSKLSKTEIVKSLKSNARFLKLWTIIFGFAGVAIVVYIMYKRYNQWRDYMDLRELRNRIQENRDRAEQDDEGNLCVICLTNPRELVLLNCGHICICAECLPQLPQPRKCPVCRGEVARAIPTFNA